MFKVLAVAWREFKHTALTKAFIIGTIIFPLLIWGGMFFASLFYTPTTTTVQGTLAIIDPTGEVIEAATIEFKPEHMRLGSEEMALELLAESEDIAPEEARRFAEASSTRSGPFGSRVAFDLDVEGFRDPEELEALRGKVRAGEYLGVTVVDAGLLDREPDERLKVSLFVPNAANPDHVSAIRDALGRAVVRARVERHTDISIETARAMMQSPGTVTRRLTDVGEAAAGVELQQMLPIAFLFLLWISAFASGNYLLTTTIEEKSNKVMEVLLSAVSPMQLMTGKILGQAIVGMFTVGVYGALGIAALFYFAMHDLITPMQIVYLAVYFLMAYFIVAAMMAGIGSAVSDLQEAHALLTPAMIVLFLPLILFIPVSQSPNGAIATVTSFIPPLTPFVMIMRVTGSEPIPIWQIISATAVGALGVLLMVWLCARIFRVGVLMYGKPPTPWELVKWLRYS